MTSDERRSKRRLLTLQRKGKLKRGETETLYADNNGKEYPNKYLAGLSSFLNILFGGFARGFPIVVPWLPYNAWAFYPFFFVRSRLNLDTQDVIKTLNHERIHVTQQRDIHLTISLPLMIFFIIAEVNKWFNPLPYVLGVPFIPTILYGVDFLRKCKWVFSETRPFSEIRETTCFEQEAIQNSSDMNYLFNRKFWAVLKYV